MFNEEVHRAVAKIDRVFVYLDYRYCWRTFVSHPHEGEGDFWPWFFPLWITFYTLELQHILLVSRYFGKNVG